MQINWPPPTHWSTPTVWTTSSTAAPTWGTVSVTQLPQPVLPQPLPGCQLQVLLRL